MEEKPISDVFGADTIVGLEWVLVPSEQHANMYDFKIRDPLGLVDPATYNTLQGNHPYTIAGSALKDMILEMRKLRAEVDQIKKSK